MGRVHPVFGQPSPLKYGRQMGILGQEYGHYQNDLSKERQPLKEVSKDDLQWKHLAAYQMTVRSNCCSIFVS